MIWVILCFVWHNYVFYLTLGLLFFSIVKMHWFHWYCILYDIIFAFLWFYDCSFLVLLRCIDLSDISFCVHHSWISLILGLSFFNIVKVNSFKNLILKCLLLVNCFNIFKMHRFQWWQNLYEIIVELLFKIIDWMN